MRFAFSPDQMLSRDALRELLREYCSALQLRAAFASEDGRVPGLWGKLSELGVVGALAPETAGGLGLSFEDLAILLEETGRAAVPDLVVETAAVAVPLLAALRGEPRADRLLEDVLAGRSAVAISFESRAVGARGAAALLQLHGDEIHLSPAASFETGVRSVDRTRWELRPAALTADTCCARGPDVAQLAAAAHDHAALGTAAELIGLGARMLELTIAHVKTRQQFGQPIGAFQAVKHQLVDAHVALEFARPLVYRAAHSIAHGDPLASVHVSMAKASASDAALSCARKALQLHGAIGYSYECDLQLFMKRAWALAAAYGDGRSHRKRIADVMLTEGHNHG